MVLLNSSQLGNLEINRNKKIRKKITRREQKDGEQLVEKGLIQYKLQLFN